MPYPERLHHNVPGWAEDGALFHIRIRSEREITLLDPVGATARAILEAAREYHERRRWFSRLLLIMPDHLHATIAFPREAHMSNVVGGWKSFLAKTAGVRWQRGFFDHRLRSRKEADECRHYIRQNPVRAGLVATQESWRFVWMPAGITTPG
jgi:putative transposase